MCIGRTSHDCTRKEPDDREIQLRRDLSPRASLSDKVMMCRQCRVLVPAATMETGV